MIYYQQNMKNRTACHFQIYFIPYILLVSHLYFNKHLFSSPIITLKYHSPLHYHKNTSKGTVQCILIKWGFIAVVFCGLWLLVFFVLILFVALSSGAAYVFTLINAADNPQAAYVDVASHFILVTQRVDIWGKSHLLQWFYIGDDGRKGCPCLVLIMISFTAPLSGSEYGATLPKAP